MWVYVVPRPRHLTTRRAATSEWPYASRSPLQPGSRQASDPHGNGHTSLLTARATPTSGTRLRSRRYGEIKAFHGVVRIPGGQLETGHAFLLVQWYDEAECGGGQVGLSATTGVSTTEPEVWYTDFAFAEAPLGAQSARLRLSVWKNEDSGTLQPHFDKVSFAAVVFVDSFESGDTSAWSATVP